MAATRILIAEPLDFSPAARQILVEAGSVEEACGEGCDLASAFQHYDVVWIRLGRHITPENLPEKPRCCVLACATTGLDHIDLDACRRRNVEVISLRGETEFLKGIRATAEFTLGVTLALLRRLPPAVESVRRGVWRRDDFRGRELYGRVAGIVGMGRLGTIVSGYFHALGMEVLGYDPYASTWPEGAVRVHRLEELLERSDVVSLHVAYDAATHHLLGYRELQHMRRGAVLINTSRGGVVDDRALVDALSQGRLAGAALDVLEGEPHIEGNPLIDYAREHENLLITPHLGGNTYESLEKTEIFIARKVVQALEAKRSR